MARIQFTYETAGLLEFYAAEVPDGDATLTLFISGQGELSGTWPQTVSLTAASSTLATGGSIGDRAITVADGTDFTVGQRYILASTLGQTVEVSLLGKSSNELTLDQPLRFAVATSSTIKSHRYAFTVTAAMNGTLQRRYRAQWSYEVASVPVVSHQYYDVVREPFNVILTEEDIEQHDPSFGEYVDAANTWLKLIEGAHNDIERKLRALQMSPDLIRDRDGLKDALIFQLLGKFYSSIPGQLERGLDWRKQANAALEDVHRGRTWYDDNDDQVVDDGGQGGGAYASSAVILSDGTVTYVDGGGDGSGASCGNELGPRASYFAVG